MSKSKTKKDVKYLPKQWWNTDLNPITGFRKLKVLNKPDRYRAECNIDTNINGHNNYVQ